MAMAASSKCLGCPRSSSIIIKTFLAFDERECTRNVQRMYNELHNESVQQFPVQTHVVHHFRTNTFCRTTKIVQQMCAQTIFSQSFFVHKNVDTKNRARHLVLAMVDHCLSNIHGSVGIHGLHGFH